MPALLALQVSPGAINFELRREHGLSEGQAAVVIRDALAAAPAEAVSMSGGRSTF